MATQEELQPAIDAALARDAAVLSERVTDGTRYSEVGGKLIGIVDDDGATKESTVRALFDADKLFRAKCLSDLAFRLGKQPAALTAAEIRAERDRIAAIYRSL